MHIKKPDFPRVIQIELCSYCNAKCIMCPTKNMKRKREVMDFELFGKIVTELKERNYDGDIQTSHTGESLLVPNFVEYLELLKVGVPKAKVYLCTNGSKLDDKLGEIILAKELLDVLIISFDGATKEEYESIRKGLSFDSVRENVHRFLSNRELMGKKKPNPSSAVSPLKII